MNQNTEYELFTREVYEQLAEATKLSASKVRHNEKLEGVSGQKHQIDVYWEYENDGKSQRVAIECKNYKRRISKEKVCAFKGVLDDLDGVNGIMVSKVGFQKGAKLYAQQYNISLKELRHPGPGETIIGEVENYIHFETRHTFFLIDEDWANKNNFDVTAYRKRLLFLFPSLNDLCNSFNHVHIDRKNDILHDSFGNEITTLSKLEQKIPDHPTQDFPFVFKFEDAYLESRYYGPIKIQEVMFSYSIKEEVKTFALDAGALVKAIMKDAQSDETDFVILH